MKRIGTQIGLSEDERGKLIAELKFWQDRSANYFGNRGKEEKAFLNLWKNQTPNGLKMGTKEEDPWPFRGSSDQRVRWGETAFRDYLALVMVALDQCKVEVTCNGTPEGERRAASIQKVVKWCRQKLGAKWYRQVQAMMRYMMVDTPAVAAMDVSWVTRKTLGVAVIDRDQTQNEYKAWRVNTNPKIAPEDAAQEFAVAVGGDYDVKLLETVEAFFVSAKKCRVQDVEDILEALDEDGECEALTTATTWEGPDIRALRYGDDFMFPTNTEDFDMADPLFRQQWMTEAELKQIASAEDWDKTWVEETLKHKGSHFYDNLDFSDAEDVKEMVNLVWFYTVETDDDGNVVHYVSVLSRADGSAFGKRVLRARRGRIETVFFSKEVLGNNLTASVGLAHDCAPDQGLAKSMKDMANNNAIVSSLPAVKAKGSRVRNVVLEPFATINMGQSDDVSWVQPPAYPAAAKEQIKTLKDDLLAFLGLSNGDTDVSSRQQNFVAWMMSQFEELYKRLVESVQDYASDEVLASVTGSGDVDGLKHEDLDGDFQLALKFNPANMNHKDLIDRVNALAQIIAPLDAKNEIDRGPVLRSAFINLFPECQDASFKSTDELVQDDIEDEQKNFVKIKAGIMPAMDTEGKWNYQARLDWYNQLQQENPDAIAEMSVGSQQIFQKWIQALEQQATQHGKNAAIGRTGVDGVMSR